MNPISAFLTPFEDNPVRTCAACLSCAIGIALLVIGCMGVAGSFQCPALGWTTLGLGCGTFVFSLCQWQDIPKEKLMQTVISSIIGVALIIILGSLGATGILNAKQLGLGIVIPSAIGLGCACCCTLILGGALIAGQSRNQT